MTSGHTAIVRRAQLRYHMVACGRGALRLPTAAPRAGTPDKVEGPAGARHLCALGEGYQNIRAMANMV